MAAAHLWRREGVWSGRGITMNTDKRIDPIPEEFDSYEEAAEFWDTHDTTDYPDAFRSVENNREGDEMKAGKVADMSLDELKDFIKAVMWETLNDPDEGLELQEEMEARLRQSLAATEVEMSTISAEEAAARLGLEW
jgi:hypothetical protein